MQSHTYTHTSAVVTYKYITTQRITLYNEERRLGDQRGSDTLVVPLITSNDGLSIAFIVKLQISSAYKMTWLELVSINTFAILIVFAIVITLA